MDEKVRQVGDRIRSSMPADMSQRELAERVQMAPDALSRALNGQRGFSITELTRIGGELGANLHWLLTGSDDPHQVNVAARHGWDPVRRKRTNPGKTEDEPVLAKITAAYRETYPKALIGSREIPADPEALGVLLEEGFIRRFAEAVEETLDVDVIRMTDISTDYSLTIGKRGIIVLAASQHWFRSNWSLAHELAHLALGHHDGAGSPTPRHESAADQFATTLLLPEALVRSIDWRTISRSDLARFIWDAGVSTQALAIRLAALDMTIADEVIELLGLSTARLLRSAIDPDEVAERQQESTARRFPLGLVADLTRRVEDGDANPQTLAWLLDVSIDDIDFPEPDEEAEAEAYERMLADRPGADDVAAWLAEMDRAS